MYLRSNKVAAGRWLASAFGLLLAAATWMPPAHSAGRYSTGSVSDPSSPERALGRSSGRSRSPYRNSSLTGSAWLAQEREPRRNPEAQKLKNPEPKTAESVEAGKKLYQRHCASCHGPQGKGDGGMALAGGTPSDLTDEAWDYGSTDGEIFVVIRDGVSSDMLGYKDKLTEKQIWQLVNFIRSIGPKPKEGQ